MESCACFAPKLPVMPWTRTLVLGVTRMDMIKFTISDLRFFPLVDANQIALGVEDESHLADGRGHRLDLKFHAVRAQVRDGFVKIFDFEADGAAVWSRRPIRRAAAERKR